MRKVKQDVTEVVLATETSVTNRTPEVIATEIRSIDDQARKYMLQSAIDIGVRLTEAKALVTHGEWGEWLQSNVNYSQSSANNFMKVATEYANSQSFVNLSYSQAVALLAVPAEEREAFAEETNAAEMSTRELQKAIKEKQELEARLSEQKENYDNWAASQKEQRDALYAQYQSETELRKKQEDKIRELEQQIDKAQADENPKETAKIKTELRKAEKAASESAKKLGELEASLKDKEIELEKTIAERLAEQKQELDKQASEKDAVYKEQLDKLNQQLQRSDNESFMKFKVHFSQLTSGFDTLLKTVEEIQDETEKNKLKAALLTTIEKMKEAL
ncbi:MAG: DUF3102 domain-containing protein [Candidatus Pristimantibacillus sp.]